MPFSRAMMRLTCAVALVSASLILAAVAEPDVAADPLAEAEQGAEAALASDDECRDSTSEQCSLNALQLKGHQASAHVSRHQINGTEAQSQAAAAGVQTLSNRSLQAGMGSCEQYVCGEDDPSQECQCNEQCESKGTCCSDYKTECFVDAKLEASSGFHHGRIVTVYHQTSYAAGHSILREGFRPGHVGYCGGGIYFAATPMQTYGKAIGPDSHWGFFLEAKVDLGRTKFIKRPSCFSPKLGVATLSGKPTWQYLKEYHADSFTFNPWDGLEYVIADPKRVISVKQYWR